MDNILKFFFSLRGRIPRETYVDAWAALLAAEIAMTWLVSFLYLTVMWSSDGGKYIFPIYAAWIAFTAIVYASQTILAAHRLHVLGRGPLGSSRPVGHCAQPLGVARSRRRDGRSLGGVYRARPRFPRPGGGTYALGRGGVFRRAVDILVHRFAGGQGAGAPWQWITGVFRLRHTHPRVKRGLLTLIFYGGKRNCDRRGYHAVRRYFCLQIAL